MSNREKNAILSVVFKQQQLYEYNLAKKPPRETHETFCRFLLPGELFGDDGIYSTVLAWRYLVIKTQGGCLKPMPSTPHH